MRWGGPGARRSMVAAAAVAVTLACLALVILWPRAAPADQGEDYFGRLEYDVQGTVLLVPFSGQVQVELFNVTEEGYWARISVEGVPGGQSKTEYFRWEDPPSYVSDLGERAGNETVQTTWGPKTLERYVLEDQGTVVTSFVGAEPRVVYLVEATGPSIELVMVLTGTDIGAIITGNA